MICSGLTIVTHAGLRSMMPVSHAVTGRRCRVERVAPGTVSVGLTIEVRPAVYTDAALFLCTLQSARDR